MPDQATSAGIRRPRRLLAVALAGTALATVVPASVAPGSSGPSCREFVDSDCIFLDRHRVKHSAERRIGRDFACAVTNKKTRRRARKLLVYVASRRAMRRAERVRWGLIHPGRARVRLTSPRYRAETLRRILEDVVERIPPRVAGSSGAGQSGGVGLGSPLDVRRCPQVSITIEPRGQASEAMERWAVDARRRHGRDRVAVERGLIRPDSD